VLLRNQGADFSPKNKDMTLTIHAIHFDADAALLEHVNKKISKLESLHDKIMKVDVYLKLDNVIHQIKDKVAEIRLTVPRHELFVKQSSKSFEESFDQALESIMMQIKKVKEKQAV
jgi:putative sigma-54 modulation protein